MPGVMERLRFSGAASFFILATVLAVIAGISVYSYLDNAVQTETVLVAVRDVAPGEVVKANDFGVKTLAIGSAPDQFLKAQDREKVVGQRARFGIVTGAVLQQQHLVPEGSFVSSKVAELGDDYRAITLPGDLVPGLSKLAPGDKLELTGVLSVDKTYKTVPLGTATVLESQQGTEKNVNKVLVTVTAEQASQLALTLRSGTLTVAVLGYGATVSPAPTLRLDTLAGLTHMAQQPSQ